MKFILRVTLKHAVILMAITMMMPAAAMAQVLEQISLDSNENQANSESHTPSINSSGRFIAFASLSGDLGANINFDICVRDLSLGVTSKVSDSEKPR